MKKSKIDVKNRLSEKKIVKLPERIIKNNYMRNFHPFFIIGTTGMIGTSLMHIFLALVLSGSSVHSIFLTLYPVFLAFLAIGMGLTLKNNKKQPA